MTIPSDIQYVSELIASISSKETEESDILTSDVVDKSHKGTEKIYQIKHWKPLEPSNNVIENDSDDSDSDSSDENNSVVDENQEDNVDIDGEEEVVIGPLRTKNEIDEKDIIDNHDYPVIPSNSINASKLLKVGVIENYVEPDRILLIRSMTDKSNNFLREGSILFLENGQDLGEIHDIFGPVTQPFYTIVRVNRNVLSSQLLRETELFFLPEYSTSISSEEVIELMKTSKGSDASNVFDEEIPEDEQEFSDDEKEISVRQLKKVQTKYNDDIHIIDKDLKRPRQEPIYQQQMFHQMHGQQQMYHQMHGQQQMYHQMHGQQQMFHEMYGQQQMFHEMPGQQQIFQQVPRQHQIYQQVPRQQQLLQQNVLAYRVPASVQQTYIQSTPGYVNLNASRHMQFSPSFPLPNNATNQIPWAGFNNSLSSSPQVTSVDVTSVAKVPKYQYSYKPIPKPFP